MTGSGHRVKSKRVGSGHESKAQTWFFYLAHHVPRSLLVYRPREDGNELAWVGGYVPLLTGLDVTSPIDTSPMPIHQTATLVI